jgi:hypothetical protein
MGAEHYPYNSADPSTPHSFQGSQSSARSEHGNGPAFYNQYSQNTPVVNGSNIPIHAAQALVQLSRPKPHSVSQAATPVLNAYHPSLMMQPPPMPEDRFDGLARYVQEQFGEHRFADYTLELRFSDDRAPAVRIPGHNIMFARSPFLKSLMLAQHQEVNGDGLTAKTLFVESDDRFLRADGFWLAMQRLYGGPLLDLGRIMSLRAVPPSMIESGIRAGRFELALGYAAAGHILQIPPVVNRGIEIAGQSIYLGTLERALDFALDGGLDSSWTLQSASEQRRCPCTYGPTVNLLLQQALNFLIVSFPPSFALNTDVGDFVHNRRLPEVPTEEAPPRNTARLSHITFGDHHPSEESASHTENTVISKVLINLPYHLLKYVLESSRLGNGNGTWVTRDVRTKVMHDIIDEREKRRLRVTSNDHLIHEMRIKDEKNWAVVAWKESVEPGTAVITRIFDDHLMPATALGE